MDLSGENDFKTELLRRISENGLKIQKDWDTHLPDFMPVVAKLVNSGGDRILTVEESAEFEFVFDYAIRKTGINFDQFDLLLRYQDAWSCLPQILEIYRKWFIEVHSIQEMEDYLSELCKI